MSEANDPKENTTGNRVTGLSKYKKEVEEGEQDAVASAD